MKIGLLGFGVVGKGVYDLLQGSQCQITKVLCRRELSLPDAQVTHDFADILQAPKDTVPYYGISKARPFR